MRTKWFHYSQNNSGGKFKYEPERGISAHVVIEAENAAEADERAERIGLYFDGCERGFDCHCCGDRWSRAWDEGEDKPSVYGMEVTLDDKPIDIEKWINGVHIFVHPLKSKFWGACEK